MKKTPGIILLLALLAFMPEAAVHAQDVRAQLPEKKSDIEKTIEDRRAIQKRIKKREERAMKLEMEKRKANPSGTYYLMTYQIIDGDTVFVAQLPAIFKFDRMKGNRNRRSWRQYRKLVYNFKRAYPYALQAKAIIHEADSVLAVNEFTEQERERYISDYQKKLFKQFEKPLRKMTISQGKLLLKLIDRELGRTSFYIIREYRGKLSAGFWQTVAKVFGNDLKKPYDRYGEDRMVEDLVLLYNTGAFDSLYYSMFYE